MNLICRFFHKLSWPHQDAQGCYQVCLEDGRHVPFKEELLPPPRPGKEPWKERERTAAENDHYLATLES